jgi:hypothetical protein
VEDRNGLIVFRALASGKEQPVQLCPCWYSLRFLLHQSRLEPKRMLQTEVDVPRFFRLRFRATSAMYVCHFGPDEQLAKIR